LAWKSGLLNAKFHPHWCNGKGIGPPKLKLLMRFHQNSEYKRPAGSYPLCDFHKICRVCTSFQDALTVQIWMDLLKGLWSYGSFKYRDQISPKFSAPTNGETMCQTPKVLRCKKMLEVLYHHAKFGEARISPTKT